MPKGYKYIDTHSHLYDEAFRDDVDGAVSRALAAGVGLILQPDVDSRERGGMKKLSERFPDVFLNMAGLYPGSVDENWEQEVELVRRSAMEDGAVAIGEIGLDYHYSKESAGLQKAALKAQLELAAELDLPVNIHLREAENDFFEVLESCRHLGLSGNLHAFSGSVETFRRIEKYGDWYVGIGGVLTFKNARVAESLKSIPLDRIVLETDSPYLTPVPYRGRRNESSYIPVIAAAVAQPGAVQPGGQAGQHGQLNACGWAGRQLRGRLGNFIGAGGQQGQITQRDGFHLAGAGAAWHTELLALGQRCLKKGQGVRLRPVGCEAEHRLGGLPLRQKAQPLRHGCPECGPLLRREGRAGLARPAARRGFFGFQRGFGLQKEHLPFR